jgi:hypothetical protein
MRGGIEMKGLSKVTVRRGPLLGVALLVCLGPSLACKVNCWWKQGGGGAPAVEIARTAPETWTVDGRPWRIEGTYYLDLPEGLQFTIDVPVADVPATMRAAEEMAWPVVRYAYEKGLYARAQLSRPGGAKQSSPQRIGVSLFRTEGSYTKGMRVAFTFADIRARLERERR